MPSEERRAYNRAWYDQRRLKAIAICGGTCAACGESDTDVLEFDHVDPDGGHKRRPSNIIVAWVMKHGCDEPPIQVLCANCHAKKSRAEAHARHT